MSATMIRSEVSFHDAQYVAGAVRAGVLKGGCVHTAVSKADGAGRHLVTFLEFTEEFIRETGLQIRGIAAVTFDPAKERAAKAAVDRLKHVVHCVANDLPVSEALSYVDADRQ